MLKNSTKKIICIILSAVLVTFLTIPVFASDLNSLLAQTEGLEEYLKQLTTDMQSLSLEYDHIQSQIDDVEEKISSNEVLLSDTQEACDQQYDLMKKRIVYLYESGETNYLTALLSAENLGDMLNRFEYINNIVDYDRDMMDKYADLVSTVDSLQGDLIAKKAELLDLRTQAMENMYKAASISDTSESEILEYGVSSDDAHDLIREYMDENGEDIRRQLEEIIQVVSAENPDYDPWAGLDSIMEVVMNDPDPSTYDWSTLEPEPVPQPAVPAEPQTQPAAPVQQVAEVTEPATQAPQQEPVTVEEPQTTAPAESPKPSDTGTTTGGNRTINTSIDQDAAYLIAALVSGEVGYTSYENQLAMAQVVINRINSDIFPDNAYDVLHQSGQFNIWDAEGNEVRTDTYYVENGPMESAMQATNEILTNGTSDDFPYMGAVTEAFYYDNPEYFTDTYGEILDGNYYFNANWW